MATLLEEPFVMQTNQTDNGMHYSIWAADNVVYGPVELPTLISWVKDERVTADTWVFDGQHERWRKASTLAELALFFRKKSSVTVDASSSAETAQITPGMLRRVKALADLADEQLERFVEFM